MKKAMIIMCAALFVAAMVLPALALDMSISGFYRVRGIYQSNADQGNVTPWDGYSGSKSPDAWWDHMLQLDPVFKVTDNVKLVTRVSMFNNQIWGSGQTSGGVPTTGALGVKSFGSSADNVLVNGAYIDWTTTKGRIKVGRMPGNFTFFTPWANTTLDADRVMYFSPTWGPFSFYAFIEKRTEDSVISGNNVADEDEDRYAALFQYTTPVLYAGYAIDYYVDKTNTTAAVTPYSAKYWKHSVCLKLADPSNTFFFEGEAQLQTGDYRDFLGATTDIKRKGWGAYGNLGMKKNAVAAGIAVAFTSGDDNNSDDRYKLGPASGLDFQPLYILYGPLSGILNAPAVGGKAGYSNTTQFVSPGATGTGSLAGWIYGDFTVNPQLALHGALGTAKADKVNDALYQSKKFGTEIDLGMKYQIMNNLAYELHFGYLWTGDFFKGSSAQNLNTDNVYQLDHSLTLSF